MDKELNTESLFNKIATLIEQSRNKIASAVNTEMVYTYYGIGRYIVEDEQHGTRAAYGQHIIKALSARLTERYGSGWSVETLKKCRKFYLVYQIGSTSQTQLTEKKVHSVDPFQDFILSWSHYQVLMRVENADERHFYELESAKEQWSVRQLQRQVASSLYERIALSKDKKEIMRLANEGQTIEKPSDIIKNPLVLEFVGLKPNESFTESRLESAIIDKLQEFLLELGKGFLFEARQKRFTFDEDNFYVDLVFYNRLLQCYVLIDLKTTKLSHQDLGQMQMYVNYFDRFIKQDFEKPTIGILLCKEKNDALVELTLPEDAQVYAQQYALCLPDKKLLQQKLQEWINDYSFPTEIL